MGGRWFYIAVAISWLLSMTWLVVEKVLPTIRRGEQPASAAYLAEAERAPEPVGWRVQWEGKEIGWAVVRSIRRPDGTADVRSVVQFESLPVDRIASELLGAFGPVVRHAFLGRGELQLDFALVTHLTFDRDGGLQRFVSRMHSSGIRDLMRVEGKVYDGRLRMVVYGYAETAPGQASTTGELYRYEVALPTHALVSDTLSPQPRLADLRVGQRWTFPVYRPFPPGSAAEIMEARVERQTTLFFDGEETRVLQVVLRREAGSGISADQDPTGRMWVRGDGAVLRQELRVANLRLMFDRIPGIQFREKALELDPAWDETARENDE